MGRVEHNRVMCARAQRPGAWPALGGALVEAPATQVLHGLAGASRRSSAGARRRLCRKTLRFRTKKFASDGAPAPFSGFGRKQKVFLKVWKVYNFRKIFKIFEKKNQKRKTFLENSTRPIAINAPNLQWTCLFGCVLARTVAASIFSARLNAPWK